MELNNCEMEKWKNIKEYPNRLDTVGSKKYKTVLF